MPATTRCPPVVGVIGPSGVGKTTLIERAIARLSASGLRVAAVKHDAHEFQMDREGKDTWRFRQAGASAVAIASRTQRATIVATASATPLFDLLETLPHDLDLILVEGYKADDVPKIEVHRRGLPLLHRSGVTGVVALVSDDEGGAALGLPRLAPDDDAAQEALLRRFLRADSARHTRPTRKRCRL